MPSKFDYESLTYAYRESVHNELADTTLKHIDNSGGLFSRLDFEPTANPSQILETVHLASTPSTPDEIDMLANIAGPTLYPEVRAQLARRQSLLRALRQQMNDHVSIFPVSNHGKMIDIAVWSAGLVQELGLDNWRSRNALVISRGVTTIKAFGTIAASEVVQKIGHVFLSFPRTDTIENTTIDEELIDDNNARMRDAVDDWLGRHLIQKIGRHSSGHALNIAISGKTDKVTYGDDHRIDSMTLGKVSHGTVKMLRGGLVLPLTLWDDAADPIVEVGELRPVKSQDDILDIQGWQADTLASRLGVDRDSIEIERAA
jgi:hypothetical protein